MHRETLKLLMAGWSHPTLPVILHRGLLPPDPDEAEAQVARHGWRALWRDGVFDYDHFHSNAFEALGVLSGWARLRLGGPEGQPVDVTPGDLLILPPGTGHARMEASEDFLLFGAYPAGQEEWDICRAPADPVTAERIAAVPRPATDAAGASWEE
ncbi:cupin domain-containing protein [Cereibacter sphaeroides]|uniref:cupin domain-containing protein n=1 Tax=Cereibacter sphaeroides TaxID=1063 RepID=UPI000F540D41|nr:cupin domain-containing protein [Cereibacter sphaeroides]AZB65816.1 cupin domain-containing protein [Cereibacter sphaeroides]AZB70573.1 cupin domain-containing protein [Cereibacter sphaeroides]